MKNVTTVYHGTKDNFDTFGYSYISQSTGTDEGFGFYFTNKRNIAEMFSQDGYVLTCEININKPLSETRKTISKSQLKKLIIAIQEKEDILSNYGEVFWSGFNNVLNDMVDSEYDTSDNDVELICSLCNCLGDKETVLKLVKKILGYDSIISNNNKYEDGTIIYIALDNNDIKIINKEKRYK